MTQKNTDFDQLKYISQFSKDNYKHYHIAINLKDRDVIEHLEKQKSKNGYIIGLIKDDMKSRED